MKTAEEHITYTVAFYYHINDNQKVLFTKAMKEYAKQVAYESLKSAADKYIGKPVKDINGRICAVSDDIIDTQILTP